MSKNSDSTGQEQQQPSDAGAQPQRSSSLRRSPPSLYHNAPTSSTSPTAGRSASGPGGDRHTHRLMEPKPLRLPLGLTSPGVAGGAYMFNTIQPSYATFGSNPSTPITSKDRRQRTPNPNVSSQDTLRRPESTSFFRSKTAAFRDDSRSRRSPHPGPSERHANLLTSNAFYERHLLQHRHGFPLWMPQPSVDAPSSYDDKGVSVGDVGIITHTGGFDFLFNICLPAEHPSNAGGPLPEGFVPLLTQQKDITESDGHPLGSFIASPSMKSVGAMAFECTGSEGAILVLPDGAIHEDVRNLGKFREYAASNAPSWYKLAVTVCKRDIDNGDIRLVTGCDKSSAWGIATFSNTGKGSDTTSLALKAQPGPDGNTAYTWECSMECDVKTSTGQEDGLRNQCTFVRCFTVSLCEPEWMKLASVNNPSDSVSETSTNESIASKFSIKARKFSKFLSSLGSKSSASSSKLSSASLQSLAELSMRTAHPASVMNRVILQKISQARLAITHDEDWALLSDAVAHSGDYVRMWDEVSQKFDVVMDPSGTAYVVEKDAKPVTEPVSPPLLAQYSGLFPFADTASLPGGLAESDFTVESLIEMISSPTAPTPAHVRLLSKLLSKQTPPRFSSLQPILPRLCNETAPVALQALGYDVMTAYWNNAKVRNASWPTTSDALSCLTFFLKAPPRWSLDLWEVRYRALVAITKDGTDLRGLETVIVSILKDCIASAFRILTNPPKGGPSLSPAECERCITTVGKFLSSLVAYRPNVARLREEMFMGVFRFYADIVDAHIQLPPSQQTQALLSPRADATLRVKVADEPGSLTQRRPQNKRRTTSLASMIYLSPPSRPEQASHTPSPRLKHPAEIGIALYLTHASAHLQQLSSTQMEDVLPLLFRALAFVALPLPRLTLHPYVSETETLEDLIINLLHSLVPSPLASVAMRIIMQHLSPQTDKFLANLQSSTQDPSTALHSFSMMIMTSLGATRAFRVYLRRALSANLERSYRPSASAPQENLGFRPNFTQELADLAWLKTDRGIGRPRVFASSIREWVHWQPELPTTVDATYDDLVDRISEAKEDILEEAAGLLKDVYQEVDSRLEGVMDSPHELAAMDDALKSLAEFLSTLKSPDGSPFIVNVFQPIESPTPLLRSIATLLSREFTPSEKHLLADILIDACEHVTDDNTARIPGLLGEDYGLMPMASSWIENWKRILNPRLLAVNRPQTRASIIATLQEAYSAIQETPSYRAELIKLIIDNRDALIAVEGSEPIFSILEDEAVIEVSEREADSTLIPNSIRVLISLVDADEPPEPVALLAVQALITIFSELSFTALSFQENNRKLSLVIFDTFLRLLSQIHEPQPRLLALQFLVRLRADRDHRVYFALESYDANESVAYLASLINRLPDSLMRAHKDEILEEHVARNKSTRSRITPSRATTSYAAMDIPGQGVDTSTDTREHEILWQLPETLTFRVVEPDSVKTTLRSFDGNFILPVSRYISTLTSLIRNEPSWELVSYILCHLPVQLSNKHLFCGPNTRQSVLELLLLLSKGVIDGSLASQTAEDCPEDLKIRDLQGLAHHTLSTLISYKASFDLQQKHLLIEAFYAGLDGPFSTIKCCLHALSLAAFEMSPSLSKCLPRILEKLAQIMSNPNMAVHILTFLAMVSSVPSLHASFTEDDFKMVFGVALQYLQHYNQLRNSPTRSWALSQHVRQQSYVTVYSWFTVLRLTDRPLHIPYVTRQLLLANEGREILDGATEVCFDWLARNTHGCANSEKTMSHNIILQPNIAKPVTLGPSKTWLYGNSFLTVKALDRKGWVEALSRRPSGSAGIVCHKEDLVRIGQDRIPPDLRACLLEDLLEAPVLEASHNIELSGDQNSQSGNSQRREEEHSTFASHLFFHLSPLSETVPESREVSEVQTLAKSLGLLDRLPVIDTHKVGIMYAGPGQTNETDILRNSHGSQAYTRFLSGIGKLVHLRSEKDFYTGSLDPDEDGEYAYAWGDDIKQILFHTATLMPTHEHDPNCNNKKRHIGNDYVRIVWNDSGKPYAFDTLSTAFQFVNIVIEPHSVGTISAFSNDAHENEYFRVIVQTAEGMTECTPVGQFKIVSAVVLPHFVRHISIFADRFTSIFSSTAHDTQRVEVKTNWAARLDAMERFHKQTRPPPPEPVTSQSETSPSS